MIPAKDDAIEVGDFVILDGDLRLWIVDEIDGDSAWISDKDGDDAWVPLSRLDRSGI